MNSSQTIKLLQSLNPNDDSLGHYDLQNILVTAVQVCNQSGTSINGWLSRRDRSRVLKKNLTFKQARKALTELIAFAISCVEACNHRDSWHTTALPLETTQSRRLTDAQKKAMQAGRNAEKQRRYREKQKAIKRRLAG